MKEFKAIAYAACSHTGEAFAYFTNKAAAEKAIRTSGVWAHDRVERRDIHIRIYERYEEYEQASQTNLKESALAKLTKPEREALGFYDDDDNE